jgi:subtilisin family serine protease
VLGVGGLCACLQIAGLAGSADAARMLAAPHEEGQILVKFRPQAKAAGLAGLKAKGLGSVLASFPRSGDVQVVSVPAGQTVGGLIARYQESGLVEFAEPDYIRTLDLAPNDPKFLDGTLWALNNNANPNADISATNGWEICNSASNIIVAVLDSGIRYTHEDLAANMWTHPGDGIHGTNAVAGTTDPSDDNGHGTLMAGVIGAVGNNGKGIVGVAWKVQLMACKCFNSGGTGTDSSIIAALDFAREHGARIVNGSFDGAGMGLSISNAISAARQAGIIFVASCGNNAVNIDVTPRYPAALDLDNVVSVAYTTANDALGQFSNFGATNVDLAAPGEGIYSTWSPTDSYYFTYPGGGTSFGGAFVSGALALMLAQYPSETYQQSIARLLEGTDPLPALSGKCVTGGRLNLLKALKLIVRLTPLPTPPAAPFQLRVGCDANRTCVVEATANLVDWSPVFTNVTSASGVFDFTDVNSAGETKRFYRAIAKP